jgi:hypothetical protein
MTPTARRILTLATVLCLAIAVTAEAASTVKVQSGTYSGTLASPRTEYTLSLKVTASKLKKATLSNIPIYCSGGGPPIAIHFGAAAISKTGKFTSKAIYRIIEGPLKGKIGDRFTMKGAFTSAGTVSGTLRTIDASVPKCGGSSRFTASL